jgi:hypothetical protein
LRILILILATIAGVTAVTAAPAQRAVWVWEEDTFRLLEEKSFEEEIITFLEQRHSMPTA